MGDSRGFGTFIRGEIPTTLLPYTLRGFQYIPNPHLPSLMYTPSQVKGTSIPPKSPYPLLFKRSISRRRTSVHWKSSNVSESRSDTKCPYTVMGRVSYRRFCRVLCVTRPGIVYHEVLYNRRRQWLVTHTNRRTFFYGCCTLNLSVLGRNSKSKPLLTYLNPIVDK